MQPFSPHNRFFSSLDRLQLRLSSEQPPKTQNQDQQPPPDPSSLSSSPLFLADPKSYQQRSAACGGGSSSGPPLDFLSDSPFPNDQQQQPEESDAAADVEALMGLLGLSICPPDSSPPSCHCSESGFYKRVVGLKGPKCGKETTRLDRWIETYRRENREPARLAHLILAKAAAMAECDDGADGIEFPATVEEFLERDPPE